MFYKQLLVSLGPFHGETQDVGDHFQRNFLNQDLFCFLNHSEPDGEIIAAIKIPLNLICFLKSSDIFPSATAARKTNMNSDLSVC